MEKIIYSVHLKSLTPRYAWLLGNFLKRSSERIEKWRLFKEKMLENENEASTIIGKVLK